jgi:hypothetical protein
MKSFARCCTKAPASRCHTRLWPVTAARCWTQPGPRSLAAQRHQQSNRPHQLPPNHQHNHRLATEGHADRALPIPRICSANRANVASRGDRGVTIKQPAHPRSKSLGIQSPRPTRVHSRVTRARRGRTLKAQPRLASVCHWQRRSRRTASLMPFRRPPAAFRRQRQTEA